MAVLNTSITSKVETVIKQNLNRNDNPFMVFNVEEIIQRHLKWPELMPRVAPHYAIKSNPLPLLLDIMVALGFKYDCASQHEIQDILGRGAKPNDIIFANPTIPNDFIKYARSKGVDLLVVDSVNQLVKVKSIFPSARIVVRILVDERYSGGGFGIKFGADMETVQEILKAAKDMKMNVMGVSFHVGEGTQSSKAYCLAIKRSSQVFDMAKGMGFSMCLLDIGGGFPGGNILHYPKVVSHVEDFGEMARGINKCLDKLFPDPHLTIIAEPGRHFCETAFTLVTKVILKRVIEYNGGDTFMYYVNDGLTQSFMVDTLLKRTHFPLPFLSNHELKSRNLQISTVWGPTLTSGDVIKSEFQFPELNVGEVILFADAGAYSITYTKFGFNGFTSPTIRVLLSEWAKNILIKTDKWPAINQGYRNANEFEEENT